MLIKTAWSNSQFRSGTRCRQGSAHLILSTFSCLTQISISRNGRSSLAFQIQLRLRTEGSSSIIMMESLLLLLLLVLPHTVCKAGADRCMGNAPIGIPHEWHQPGEMLVGGITTHIYYLSPKFSFKQHPSQEQIQKLPV